MLNLSGAPCHDRLTIELAGRPLTLRLKSFKYLLALASARLLTPPPGDGWIAKTDIEPGENQIKYLYQLRRELAQGGHNNTTLIENDGNGHYRLALPPQAIRVDLSRLLEHPDWDIRARAGVLWDRLIAGQTRETCKEAILKRFISKDGKEEGTMSLLVPPSQSESGV